MYVQANIKIYANPTNQPEQILFLSVIDQVKAKTNIGAKMKFLAATIISLASIAVAQPYSTPPTDHATTTSDCSTRTSTYPTTTSDCTTSTSSCKSTETPKACPKHCDDGKPEEVCLVSNASYSRHDITN